jgi:hypothetical protein
MVEAVANVKHTMLDISAHLALNVVIMTAMVTQPQMLSYLA